eukprot:3504965-Amphidinium_carterae.1
MGTPEQPAGHLHVALEACCMSAGVPERARCALGAAPGTPAMAVAQNCGSLSTVEEDGQLCSGEF